MACTHFHQRRDEFLHAEACQAHLRRMGRIDEWQLAVARKSLFIENEN